MSRDMPGRTRGDHTSVLARRAVARIAAIGFLVASGAIHTAQIQVHLDEWNLAGLFFIASAVVQVGLAVALARGMDRGARDVGGVVRSFSTLPSRKLIIGVIATSLALLVVWAISRTVGIPFGPHAGIPEPVNRPDSLAAMFELLALAAIFPLLSRKSPRRTSWVPRRSHTVIVGALLLSTFATTAFALQPVTCDAAPSAEEQLTEREKADQALVDAFVYHGDAEEHPADTSGHGEEQQGEDHDSGDDASVDCH